MRLIERAREELRPGEALVFDWHTLAICCAAAGEVSLRRTTTSEVANSRKFVRLSDDDSTPLYAHRRMYPHLAGRKIEVDCRRRLGLRHFTSNLPGDFGLRAILGRLPADSVPGGSR